MMQSQDLRKFPGLYFMVFIMLTYTSPSFYDLAVTEMRDGMVDDVLHVWQVFLAHIISILFKLQARNLSRMKHARI